MAAHLARFTAPEGVVFISKAQEKTRVFRTEKRLGRTALRPLRLGVRTGPSVVSRQGAKGYEAKPIRHAF